MRTLSRRDRIRLFLASGLGLGLAPVFPGSFGALPGLGFPFLVRWLFHGNEWMVRGCCLLAALAVSAVHYRLTPWAQKYWGDSDPGHFVLDEIVGSLCVPLFLCFIPTPAWMVAGFLVFRILDAIKLPGARYIDRNIHTASGVLFDDVVSALYTALLLSAVHCLL